MSQRHLESKPNGAEKLSAVLERLFEENIELQRDKYGSVCEVWRRVLPDTLRQHCWILEVNGGVLNIAVDCPAYVYELRLHSGALLGQLRQDCKRLRIKSIKYTLANKEDNFKEDKRGG